MHRNTADLNYPSDTKSNPRQKVRTTIPGHSYSEGFNSFIDNMGDPRMSFYNQSPQDANVYPENFSPNRRNIRTGTIYSGSNTNTVYGRVLPSGMAGWRARLGIRHGYDLRLAGDESNQRSPAIPASSRTMRRFINPCHTITTIPQASCTCEKGSLPMRISNLGRFYSATELGRVYDPIMWQVRGDNDNTTPPGRSWGRRAIFQHLKRETRWR